MEAWVQYVLIAVVSLCGLGFLVNLARDARDLFRRKMGVVSAEELSVIQARLTLIEHELKNLTH